MSSVWLPVSTRRWPSVSARRLDMLAIALVGLLALGFFNPIFRVDATFSDIAGHQTVMFPWAAHPNGFNDAFPQSDQANAFHPWQVLINRSLDEGTLPYWNRYSFAGAPFMTNGAGGGLYPPRFVLSALVSPSWVHDLFLLLHVFLSGVAMYLLLRELGARFLGSFFSAVAWMFSSHTLGWLQLEYIAVIAVVLPAGLFMVHRAFRLRSLWWAFGAGLVLGVCSFQSVMVTLLVFPVVLGYAAAQGVRELVAGYRSSDRRRLRLGIAAPLTALGGAVGSAALVLVPTGLMAAEAGREAHRYEDLVRDFDVPTDAFLTALRPSSEIVSADLLHELVFVGSAAALLAVVGAVSRRPGALLGVLLVVVTFLVTIGTPVTWFAYTFVPGFEHFRPLGRALFLWCFGIALLGGLGLDALQRWTAGRRFRTLELAVGAIGLVAVAATLFQLIPYGRKINPPFQPRDEAFLYPETAAVKALYRDRERRPSTEVQRLLPLRQDFGELPWRVPVLWGGVATAIGVESMSGYESIVPNRILTMNRVLAGETPDHALDVAHFGAYLPSFFVSVTRYDLLPRMGVTTIYAPPDIDQDPLWNPERMPIRLKRIYAGPEGWIFELAGIQPRAYVVYGVEPVNTPRAALRRFADREFDHRRAVILEPDEARRTAGAAGASTEAIGTPARVLSIETNSEKYDVDSAAPGWLVIASMWEAGWRARVNGDDADVVRANYNQRAVQIPAGHSRVELEYRPRGLEVGAALTAMTLCAPLVLLAFTRARRSRV
jgi:hypothetical protein